MRVSGGQTHRQLHTDHSSSSCSSSGSRVRCSAIAQRSRRRGLQVTTPYHLSLEQEQPEVEDVASTSASTSSASLYAAELGMRLNLRRLERLFGNSRHSEEENSGPSAPGEDDEESSSVPSSWFLVQLEDKPQRTKNQEKTPDYFANVGDAIRTLREDIPSLFEKDLNYSIYRDDILFKDPRNSFQGMKNYQLIFWSLRFHGKIFFSKLYVDVKRIWQPPNEDGVVKMRWTVHGIPRVPWEAEGTFDGISTYKLDKSGKIYEHIVDNVLLRDPPMLRNPLLAGLNLAPLQQDQTPQLGAWFRDQPEPSQLPRDTAAAGAAGAQSAASAAPPPTSSHWLTHVTFSWVRLYASLLGTVQLTAGITAGLTAGLMSLSQGSEGSSSTQEAQATGSS